jgi:hypothetical protein
VARSACHGGHAFEMAAKWIKWTLQTRRFDPIKFGKPRRSRDTWPKIWIAEEFTHVAKLFQRVRLVVAYGLVSAPLPVFFETAFTLVRSSIDVRFISASMNQFSNALYSKLCRTSLPPALPLGS